MIQGQQQENMMSTSNSSVLSLCSCTWFYWSGNPVYVGSRNGTVLPDNIIVECRVFLFPCSTCGTDDLSSATDHDLSSATDRDLSRDHLDHIPVFICRYIIRDVAQALHTRYHTPSRYHQVKERVPGYVCGQKNEPCHPPADG